MRFMLKSLTSAFLFSVNLSAYPAFQPQRCPCGEHAPGRVASAEAKSFYFGSGKQASSAPSFSAVLRVSGRLLRPPAERPEKRKQSEANYIPAYSTTRLHHTRLGRAAASSASLRACELCELCEPCRPG